MASVIVIGSRCDQLQSRRYRWDRHVRLSRSATAATSAIATCARAMTVSKKSRRIHEPRNYQERIRHLLSAFPCPECGSPFQALQTLYVPPHFANEVMCTGSNRSIGFFEDGVAAIPQSHSRTKDALDARRRMRKFLRELPPSKRVSTSVVANRAGRDWDVSSGLPSHGKGRR